MRIIDFKSKYDACIILNADYPDTDFFEKMNNVPIIAADGAANRMLKEKRHIDYIIGDLDSLDHGYVLAENTKLIQIKDQETNDFEKALKFCIDSNYSNVVVAGFHGGELEHSLNNWSVFARFSKLLTLCIFDKGRYGFAVNESVQILSYKGETVSLIPQCKCKLTSYNLKWSLSNEYLEIGIREGARNVSLSDSFSLDIFEGELIVFVDAKLPYSL